MTVPIYRDILSHNPYVVHLQLIGSLDIRDLKPGTQYEVLRDIIDFHGQSFVAGQHVTFVRRHYLPYDDGHTVVFSQEHEFRPGSFREVSIYLQGSDHRDVVENADVYFGAIPATT